VVEVKLHVFYGSGADGYNVSHMLPPLTLPKGKEFVSHIRILQLTRKAERNV
jgi:hypothetical protein